MAKISNVVLIGMPGAGKSTVGVVLAKRMGMHFIDSDLLIQEETDMLLEEIISTYGIDEFLSVENKIVSNVNIEKSVFATGGSMCHCIDAMKHLGENSEIVYLKLSLNTVKERLGDFSERGVTLRKGQTLEDLYEERVPLYEKYADHVIECENKSIRDIVIEISGKF